MKNEFEYLNDVNMDFSIYNDEILTDEERLKMKNIIKTGKVHSYRKNIAVAACVCAFVFLSVTAYATGFVGRVIKTLTTGNNQFSQIDMSGVTAKLPKEFKGIFFDETGKEIENFESGMLLYDKEGNKIENVQEYVESLGIDAIEIDGQSVKLYYGNEKNPLEDAREKGYPIIDDTNKINEYLEFDAKLPEYIPEGYSFYGASAYGTEYLFVYYMNNSTNEYIMIDERIINDDTAFSAGTDGVIEEITINERKAVLMNNQSVDWEDGNISIGVNGRGNISVEELTKIAESIK